MAAAALAAALAALAGCGGPAKPSSQTVAGDGFTFTAPAAWVVERSGNAVSASTGKTDRVEVIRFALVHPYRRSLFAKTARELDALAERLADQHAGRVVSRTTVQLAGGPTRMYALAYPGALRLEIDFVLVGNSEYELLCQRTRSSPAAPCSQLLSSFTLSGA